MDAKVGANRRNSTWLQNRCGKAIDTARLAKCTDDNLVSAARSTAHWLVRKAK
jgi:hypothetical protein